MIKVFWPRINKEVDFLNFTRQGVDIVHEQARMHFTDARSIEVYVLLKVIDNCHEFFSKVDSLGLNSSCAPETIIKELYDLHKKAYSD